MDSNYLDRVTARRQLIAEHASAVSGTTAAGHSPVRELYSYLLGTYLPTRYPTMFRLVQAQEAPTNDEPRTLFHNKVTNLTWPLDPPPSSPSEMLKILGETVEDDMFLLVRDNAGTLGTDPPAAGGAGEHRAVAFVCCHPSGFDPAGKLGKRLAEIHAPVPAYDKIGASMERYFARLEVGRRAKRVNVGVFFFVSCFFLPFFSLSTLFLFLFLLPTLVKDCGY